ncbi:MAG TPA: ABC transporter permease [Micromonosporaceae bacterium]|jgi:ABC-2 type transport system permease protein|nr:ABC transporter permease [Micromonosporaceae bacterium]
MKLLRDTWLIFQRQVLLVLRNPAWMIIGIFQPFLFLTLFGPLLKPIFPEGNAYNIFVPGLLIQLGLFGSMFVGFGLIAELRAGVIERSRVTPVSRVALLLGRSLRDVLTLLVQATVLVVMAIPFGLSVNVGDVVLAFLLVGLIALLLSAISYALALIVKNEDAFAPLTNTLIMPVWLLAGIFLPMTFAPGWLKAISEWNPFTWAVDGTRALFAGDPGNPAVWKSLVIIGALTLAATVWAGRLFARSVR